MLLGKWFLMTRSIATEESDSVHCDDDGEEVDASQSVLRYVGVYWWRYLCVIMGNGLWTCLRWSALQVFDRRSR